MRRGVGRVFWVDFINPVVIRVIMHADFINPAVIRVIMHVDFINPTVVGLLSSLILLTLLSSGYYLH